MIPYPLYRNLLVKRFGVWIEYDGPTGCYIPDREELSTLSQQDRSELYREMDKLDQLIEGWMIRSNDRLFFTC
jgi:hypothetical protein